LNKRKLLGIVINNRSNVRFNDFVALLEYFGFRLARTKGSHRIYRNASIPKSISIQNDNGQAKPYQIDQFLKIVEKYQLEARD